MKFICSASLIIFLSFVSKAQKLPDVQTIALNAPINIKIDGKGTEWGDNFAANNKRTSLLYSMANDDKNLYLVIKSSGSANINKIMMGGITLSVNTDGKKKEKDAPSVTYPVIKRTARAQAGGRQAGGAGGQGRGGNTAGDATGQNRVQLTTAQRDSLSLINYKTQLAAVKEIKVLGFKNITDSLISIYNEYGIKTLATFDDTGGMIYELAIPLSLLNLSTANPKEFAYQIKVNGLVTTSFGGAAGGGGRGGSGGGGAGGGRIGGGSFGGQAGGTSSFQDLMSPTDFWGKYSLKK